MIRSLLRLGVVGTIGAIAVDRWLAGRADPGSTEIVSTVEIGAAPDAVWAVIADIEAQPAWMHDLKRVRILTGSPIGVGTRALGTVRILGISVEDPIEITVFDPPTRYAIDHRGLFVGTGTIELTPSPVGTHVRWTEVLVPPVLPYLGAIIQRPILGAIFQADLDRLRELVESNVPSASPTHA